MEKKDEKKQKVIHTRVSLSLDEELRERASGLGVSVSNLVRNVLLNTFGLVENVVADSANVARSVTRTDEEPAGGGDVIGWQALVLNLNAVCVTCNAILPKGTDAAIGVTGSGARPISCLACVEAVKKAAQSDASNTTAQSKSDDAG